MMIDLTLTHTRVAAACTWGATEATILRELLGPTPALCERLPVLRAIEDLEALGALQRSADGHFWLMGGGDSDATPALGLTYTPAGDARPRPSHHPIAPAAVAADPAIRAEPIRTTDAAIRYLEAHGYSVVPLARGIYLIDGTSSLGKADLIDRAEILRARTMKRHQHRKARAA